MGELPTGTVTMLFSDIEGSTVLLGRLGARYLEALDAHRSILRAAWTTHGGTEMGTEGDSFFVVFPTAGAAVSAATQAQRGLQQRSWAGGERLRVRIGIHTGTPQLHHGDYWGMDVHRAARIAGSAHGGQVVLSGVTAELVRPGLPPDVDLVDLGFHHLKDLVEPEHLYQLAAEGLPHDFPALRSLGTSSSLPHPGHPAGGTRTGGRGADRAAVHARCPARDAHRHRWRREDPVGDRGRRAPRDAVPRRRSSSSRSPRSRPPR